MTGNSKRMAGFVGGPVAAAVVAGALFGAAPAPAQARTVLTEDELINQSLVAAAVGEFIRRNCSTIGARYLVVMERARELEDYALSLGYTEEEIQAFLDSRWQRRRVREAAQSYMAEKGVVKGVEETYCALGRDEIENDTLTGTLLYSWQ